MATYRNWAVQIARSKPRNCTMNSWGMGFETPDGNPTSTGMSFRREPLSGTTASAEFMEITLEPEEAFKLEQSLREFRERREYHTKQKQKQQAKPLGPALTDGGPGDNRVK
jgi:hypothetical protein